MENQTKSWPQLSAYGAKHRSHLLVAVLACALQMCFLFAYLFYPTWLLLILNVSLWFLTSLYVVFRAFTDHEMIVRLRRMYVDYFAYCVELKKCSYRLAHPEQREKRQ